MKHIFITGISKGIGKALVLHYLKKGMRVTGIGRSHAIEHSLFDFIKCDLSEWDQLKNISLVSDCKHLILINNAGILGTVNALRNQKEGDFKQVIDVNLCAAMTLCQKLLQESKSDTHIQIVNISSGAAKRPIPSWAAYCASKAALDMFSQCLYLEEKERNRNTKVYSIAPGVVDTGMQNQIRESKQEEFSEVQNFIELNEKHLLKSPKIVAQQISELLESDYDEQVVYRLP